MSYYDRHIALSLNAALLDTPVVLINGPRQSGKSTLVQRLKEKQVRQYLTLDDPGVLTAATIDPQGFIDHFDKPVALDEIQRAPALFLAIKAAVDRQRTPGRFLLTGSANILLLPKAAESLAGRMEILTLWPLAASELNAKRANIIEQLFAQKFSPTAPAVIRDKFIEQLVWGGYPEAVARENETRRRAWFRAYLKTLIERDVRELAHIEGLSELPRLTQLLAARSAMLLNYAEVGRDAGFSQTTLARYLTLLEATFLVQTVPPWFVNVGKRLIKSPKIFFNDTGLLCYLLGLSQDQLTRDLGLPGAVVETFVFSELNKALTWSEVEAKIYHYRTATQVEVDFVLQSQEGSLVGIEVKASATLRANDLNGLRKLQEASGKYFKRGIVFYTGREVISFGNNFFAVPLSMLWT